MIVSTAVSRGGDINENYRVTTTINSSDIIMRRAGGRAMQLVQNQTCTVVDGWLRHIDGV